VIKADFRRFLEANPGRVHFAAHSHHFWPDVSFDAHAQAWLDAASLADRKWDKVFGEIVPRTQKRIARLLGLPDPTSIGFAPNVHEIVMRIASCLRRPGPGKPLRVLSTDAEFHSFARQAARLEEDGEWAVTRIAAEPFATFTERFAGAAAAGGWDLVYLSHAFFSSGYVVPDVARIVAAVPEHETFVVVDGYHAFAAMPVDLSKVAARAFYVAGGYKYAMSGEGCCFVHAPPGYGERPRDTGWFAAFGALEGGHAEDQVPYGPGGARFMGATFDPTPLYRMDAVLAWLERVGLTPAKIHAHAHAMQAVFLREIGKGPLPLDASQLVVPMSEPSRGQFLTFRTPRAAELHARLLAADIVTDVRGDRLRFGFGVYHDEQDVVSGAARVRAALG
jgi:kynureninase